MIKVISAVALACLSTTTFAGTPMTKVDPVEWSLCSIDAHGALLAAKIAASKGEADTDEYMRQRYIGGASPDQLKLAKLARSLLAIEQGAQQAQSADDAQRRPATDRDIEQVIAGVCIQAGVHSK